MHWRYSTRLNAIVLMRYWQSNGSGPFVLRREGCSSHSDRSTGRLSISNSPISVEYLSLKM
jgi:hypothetical protein